MSGVPATPKMHFRNGAMVFTYMSTLLLELVDRKKVRLDTKLSRFRPVLPYANRITLKNLANMTSGYADYVYQPEVLNGVNLYRSVDTYLPEAYDDKGNFKDASLAAFGAIADALAPHAFSKP